MFSSIDSSEHKIGIHAIGNLLPSFFPPRLLPSLFLLTRRFRPLRVLILYQNDLLQEKKHNMLGHECYEWVKVGFSI